MGADSTFQALAKATIVQKHCVEKNGEAGLKSCPIDFVSLGTPPPSPPSMSSEAPPVRRASERLACRSQRRSYFTMLGHFAALMLNSH